MLFVLSVNCNVIAICIYRHCIMSEWVGMRIAVLVCTWNMDQKMRYGHVL